MSLILDALNRSHEETDEVPTIGTRHDYAARHPGSRLLLAVVLALAAALVMIGWLLWDREQEAPPEAISQPAPAKMAIEARGVTSAPEPEPVQQLAPEPVAASEKSLAEPVKAESVIAEPVIAETAAEPEPEPKYQAQQPTSANDDVNALYAEKSPDGSGGARSVSESLPAAPKSVNTQEPVSEEAPAVPAAESVAEQALDIEQMLKHAEDELQNAQLEEHSAPFVNNLSQQTKDAIPSVYYERHEYSGRPGQSRVVLNGKELKVGGSAASGVKVEEILPDSVVLNYRGTQFRLRALNSWVNL